MKALAENPRETVLGVLKAAATADLHMQTASLDPDGRTQVQPTIPDFPPGLLEAHARYERMAPKVNGQRTVTRDSLREALEAFADAGYFHATIEDDDERSRFLRAADGAGFRDEDIATMYAKPGERVGATLDRIHIDRVLDGRDPCSGQPLGDHPKLIAGRRAAQLRTEGRSYQEAADRMNAEGFQIKHGQQVKRLFDKPWPANIVRVCAECGEALPHGASPKMRRHPSCRERAKRRAQRR